MAWKVSSGTFERESTPKTGADLQPAVELDPVSPPTRSNMVVEEHKPPEGFYEYIPINLPTAVPASSGGGPSTADRQAAMLERITMKERANTAVVVDAETNDEAGNAGSTNSGNPRGVFFARPRERWIY